MVRGMNLKILLPVVSTLSVCAFAGAKVPPPDPHPEKVEIAIDSPATNYRIKIQEIRMVGAEIWVLSEVGTAGDIGGAAITTIRDVVLIEHTGLPHKHFVAGKSWGWAEPKTVTYLPVGEGMTDEKWKAGKVIWTRPKEGDKGEGDKG